ncbi:PA2779 family protein [Alteromonas sp. 009811495]|uniref:PA2779 family protein n=1 Tax=Alteromonas sp. 009811495 TaxID=3002962 RepID=UPI00237DF7A7|nr:PA2779 family protein [Alteromonas sp. 009811495]WDT86973.1 PA2779 family protein [Alteromonas sp. 009811495]
MKYLKSMAIGCFSATVLMAGGAQAEAISSDTVMQTQAAQYNKQQLIDMVSRADVQSKLVGLGVDSDDAIARINAMTDSEISQLNAEINQAPAGGVVGAVLTVLAVIAILDLAGVTDVYPFIRPISN